MSKVANNIKNEEGLTLIELIISIIIISVIITAGLSFFTKQKQKDSDSDVKADMGRVVTQIETMLVENPNANMIYSTPEGTTLNVTVGNAGAPTTAKVNLSSGGVNIVVNGGGSAAENTFGTASGYYIWAWHDNGRTYTENNPLEYNNNTR